MEMIGIKVVEPYVPATTVVLAKLKDTFPAVPPPVNPVPGATWVTAYEPTLAESTRVVVCPTKRFISEAEALTTPPFKNMVWKLAEPDTASLYAPGAVPPSAIFPLFETYKACCVADDPVTKRPNDDEVTIVVKRSREPPRMTVDEEFVSPFPNDRGDW